ncbi:NAD(P)/FAD-dependent oxidoreductase [Streptomyces sp. NPDC020917]|uniref:NAD(P)/FAD-dependent oxidoreductase n=1 Tax=Streptomyces sp. NPDC020917 TaxID=3365102 RepID=UPI00379C1800
MSSRVLVLGAGYAGLPAAKRIARQVLPGEVEVTLVNGTADFVERPRLHQIAMGQDVKVVPLRSYLDGSGVRFVRGWVRSIDVDAHAVAVEEDGGLRHHPYDILVYALGSRTDVGTVPGVREHALTLDTLDGAALASNALRGLEPSATVVVCGGGLTGIETATEVAESLPELDVRLVSSTEPGHWLSGKARRHLHHVLDELRIDVTCGARVREVRSGELVLEQGRRIPFGVGFWAGGFGVPALARESGLAVTAQGRARVDARMQSLSHPDVYVIGDAAAVAGSWGEEFAMGCRTGGFTGPKVADVVAARLTGRETGPLRFRYIHECISLGRRHGVVQFLDADGSPIPRILTGRKAITYKNAVLNSARLVFGHAGPALARRRHVADAGTAAIPAAARQSA